MGAPFRCRVGAPLGAIRRCRRGDHRRKRKTPGTGRGFSSSPRKTAAIRHSDCVPAASSVSAAWAAARRAIGTRGPEQDT